MVERVIAAVTNSPGHTSPRLRRALVERSSAEVPGDLQHYVDTVARHAYRVSDEDIEALRRDGNDDDEIFEVTAATALGAALLRLERGMAAMEEKR